MSSEYQTLSAFRLWRDVARGIHAVEALPTDEELIAAAQDHTELDPGGRYPALLVWATALKRVRALALTGNTDAIPRPSDASLYQPDLEAQPEPRHYAEFEDVVEPAEPATEATPEPDTSAPAPEPVAAPEPEPVAEPEPAPVAPPEAQETPGAQEPQQRTPRVKRSRHAAGRLEKELRHFEPHEFSRVDPFADVVAIPGAEFRVQPTADGLDLQWEVPDADGGPLVRLFRVVSDEVEFELDPDFGEQRAVTIGTHWVDVEELSTAYRMYQVWMHEGSSETQALDSEPQLVGEKWYIRPVEHIDLSVAGSVIKGQWEPEKHTEQVFVYAAPESERRTRHPENEITGGNGSLQGFRFTPDFLGIRYKFVAERYVRIRDRVIASAPSEEFTVAVPAEVVEVDINVTEHSDGFDTRFDVEWARPNSGEVRIYRTRTAPADGLSDRVVEVDQLDSFGLSQRDWANDLERGAGRCRVDWPDEWYSVFLTPVSVVGNQAKVGRSHSLVRVGQVSNARLHERVNNQLLTFGWAEEAHQVTAVFGDRGSARPLSYDPTGPGEAVASIYREAYEEEGGMRIQLPAAGEIALFPSRVYEGREIWGNPVVLNYDGLQRFSYQLQLQDQRLYLAIFAEREDYEYRQLTLRLQSERLPLEPDDGIEIMTRRMGPDGPVEPDFSPGITTTQLAPLGREPVEYWEVDPAVFSQPHSSLLRLFFRSEHDPDTPVAALIDPNPNHLELGFWMSGRGR